ncbi:MAG TPA: DinB family protein [Chitinophagaceae bacterium]
MNKEQLRNDLDTTLSELYDVYASIPVEAVNTSPFPGSWTSGQLVRHLVMANGGCLEEINGPVQETTRPINTGVESIRNVFLDFSTKMTAPEFVVPPAIAYEKEEGLASLDEIRQGLLAGLDTLDLSKTCLLFELPVLGFLTRWEILHFVVYHTRRHIQQLKKMKESLEAGVESRML